VEGVKLLKQFGDPRSANHPPKRGVNERKTNQINLHETLAWSRDAIDFNVTGHQFCANTSRDSKTFRESRKIRNDEWKIENEK